MDCDALFYFVPVFPGFGYENGYEIQCLRRRSGPGCSRADRGFSPGPAPLVEPHVHRQCVGLLLLGGHRIVGDQAHGAGGGGGAPSLVSARLAAMPPPRIAPAARSCHRTECKTKELDPRAFSREEVGQIILGGNSERLSACWHGIATERPGFLGTSDRSTQDARGGNYIPRRVVSRIKGIKALSDSVTNNPSPYDTRPSPPPLRSGEQSAFPPEAARGMMRPEVPYALERSPCADAPAYGTERYPRG